MPDTKPATKPDNKTKSATKPDNKTKSAPKPEPKPEVVKISLTAAARLAVYQVVTFSRRCGKCGVDHLSTTNLLEMKQSIELTDILGLEVFGGESFKVSILQNTEVVVYSLSKTLAKRLYDKLNKLGRYISLILPAELGEAYGVLEAEFGDIKEVEGERSYSLGLSHDDRELIHRALSSPIPCMACTAPVDGFMPDTWGRLRGIADNLKLWGFIRKEEVEAPDIPGPEDYTIRRDEMELLLDCLTKRSGLVNDKARDLLKIVDQLEKMRVGEVAPVPE